MEDKCVKKDEMCKGNLGSYKEQEMNWEGPSKQALRNDLILETIFSHLADKDLLVARLVTKQWTLLATEELRMRSSNCPWIGRIRQVGSIRHIELNDEAVTSFVELMTSSPLIPFQQIALRFDILSIQPSALKELLKFVAPWVKTLRLCPYVSFNTEIDQDVPLFGEEGMKVVAWTAALHNLNGLQFTCLATLEIGDITHQFSFVSSFIHDAPNLKTFIYNNRYILYDELEEEAEAEIAEREITKGIILALPSSLKRLDFVSEHCPVDYKALATLGLNLEELMGTGKPESPQEFLNFIDGQKICLRTMVLPNLEEIYGPDFPQIPLITKFTMNVKPTSTFECLKVFPSLRTLRINMQRGLGGVYYNMIPIQNIPMDIQYMINIPTHPSVQELVVRGFRGIRFINVEFLASVFPNIIHIDYHITNLNQLTKLFTQFESLQCLQLGLEHVMEYEELENVLSGVPPSIYRITDAYSIHDDAKFEVISNMAAKDPTSTIGMDNLKSLQILIISASSYNPCPIILNNLMFQLVFKKMTSLKEIRLFGEIVKDCVPVLDGLNERGIRVNVFTRK